MVASIVNMIVQQIFNEKPVPKSEEDFFPAETYESKLTGIITETQSAFEKIYPCDKSDGRFPLLRIRKNFELLTKVILFESEDSPLKIEEFIQNEFIIPPTTEQLEIFYEIFVSKINTDEELKLIHIEDTYKARIFELYNTAKKHTRIPKECQVRLMKSPFKLKCSSDHKQIIR
jgi:hypothetical protein